MKQYLGAFAMAAPLLVAVPTGPALAQKPGGILKMYSPDSPASMSIVEEATFVAEGPMMGVFNNLVMFDQRVKQNSPGSIVPDLAASWSWNEEGTELTLPLREGIRWHDGKPFTARDVQCTFDLLTGKSSEKLRINPRKAWWRNLEAVTANGDYEVTFHLKRPQPAILMALAGGFSPIYPCHVAPRDMRQRPIGTGPPHGSGFGPGPGRFPRGNRAARARCGSEGRAAGNEQRRVGENIPTSAPLDTRELGPLGKRQTQGLILRAAISETSGRPITINRRHAPCLARSPFTPFAPISGGFIVFSSRFLKLSIPLRQSG